VTDLLQQQVDDLTGEFRDFAGEVDGHLTTITDEQKRIGGEHVSQAQWIAENGPIVEDHARLLGEHGDRLEQDTTLLAGLREDVNLVLAEMPRQPQHPPVCWAGLTADQAEQTWTLLGEWVADVLVDRYFANRAQLPDCWALHPGAVEELSWLRTAWLHAFVPTAGAVPGAEWHTRWRQAALDGVTAAVKREADTRRKTRCGVGVHLGEPLRGAATAPQHVPVDVGAPPVPEGSPPTWTPGALPAQQFAPGCGPSGLPPVSVPRGPASSSGRPDLTRDPEEDLAERSFWWPHLKRAAAEDVVARRTTEAEAAAAAASALTSTD